MRGLRSAFPDSLRQRVAQVVQTLHEAPDDPQAYDSTFGADSTRHFPRLSGPLWVVPGPGLPHSVQPLRSNNNVSLCIYQGRIYLAFRTAHSHFASRRTRLYVISSRDLRAWELELLLKPGQDLREPHLMVINDTLHLYFFLAGKNPLKFQPQRVGHYVKMGADWLSEPVELPPGTVPWDLKKRYQQLFLTGYAGAHYRLWGESALQLSFYQSQDGRTFRPVEGADTPLVYVGGASECAFEFDRQGNLWAVTRLEDGDRQGFGSQIAFARWGAWHRWSFGPPDPHCYMSPKLLRYGAEIYLIARRQLGKKPFARAKPTWPLWRQRLTNWVSFSLSPKTTALYRIDRLHQKVVWVCNLVGAGDTAFPSIQRIGRDEFLIANYSSAPNSRRSWLRGQLGRTGIYLMLLSFERHP